MTGTRGRKGNDRLAIFLGSSSTTRQRRRDSRGVDVPRQYMLAGCLEMHGWAVGSEGMLFDQIGEYFIHLIVYSFVEGS